MYASAAHVRTRNIPIAIFWHSKRVKLRTVQKRFISAHKLPKREIVGARPTISAIISIIHQGILMGYVLS
jgi:hypothetical protein